MGVIFLVAYPKKGIPSQLLKIATAYNLAIKLGILQIKNLREPSLQSSFVNICNNSCLNFKRNSGK